MLSYKENFLFKKTENLFIKKVKSIIITALFYIFRCFPIVSNKIVISSYRGLGFKGNPKYIVNELLESNIPCQLVWITSKNTSDMYPPKIRLTPYNTIRSIYELCTAKIWIDDCRKERWVRKRKKQYYIQTWHGGIGPKKVEKDIIGKISNEYILGAKQDSKMADLFLSNSTYRTNLYRSSFWYYGAVLEKGLPRNDLLFSNQSEKYTRKVKHFFQLSEDTKIILYTPTFRKDFNVKHHQIDFEPLCNFMENKTNKKWVVLIHLHPNVARQSSSLTYSEYFLNANKYSDIQELYLASDMLITDYSSSMFDFALTKKPVFLYTFDIASYKEDRNFYFDLSKLPFPSASTMDELITKISDFCYDKYLVKLDKSLSFFGEKESGCASNAVVQVISNYLEES